MRNFCHVTFKMLQGVSQERKGQVMSAFAFMRQKEMLQ